MDIVSEFVPSKFNGKLNKKQMKKRNEIYARIIANTTQHCDGAGDCCLRVSKDDAGKRHKNPARSRYGHSLSLSNAGIALAKQDQRVQSKYYFELYDQMRIHICGDPINIKSSKCVNPAHIKIKSRQYNDSQKFCHNYIRNNERKYRYKTAINVSGKVKVSSINQIATHKATLESYLTLNKCTY